MKAGKFLLEFAGFFIYNRYFKRGNKLKIKHGQLNIELISDVHFEFGSLPSFFSIPEDTDVLVLAGDIASGVTNVYDALKAFRKQTNADIVYVMGNHEHYSGAREIEEFSELLLQKTQAMDRVHFLERESVEIKGVHFIGATLWTNFRDDIWARQAAKEMITDFRRIKKFSTLACETIHYSTKIYLKTAYENLQGPKVIVTHFLPAIECISPQYQNPKNLLNYYFANDMGGWISELKDTVWMFGHTHDSVDIVLGDTRCVCNPYGYFGHQLNKEFK